MQARRMHLLSMGYSPAQLDLLELSHKVPKRREEKGPQVMAGSIVSLDTTVTAAEL
jgi:hypothetical protein